jgi:pimeloyl-ACP methyl ester carboxylesterase
MALRLRGRRIDPLRPAASLAAAGAAPATRRLLVLVHGLCMNDRQWERDGHDHGQALAKACGMTPLYLHYNSGRAIADNGRNLAELLQTVATHWPQPLQEIVLIGHSMGGLVARSACHWAAQHGMTWHHRLRRLIFLGTPHLGAPLERGGHGLSEVLSLSPYAAPLARIGRTRSAGIQDLRHGCFTATPPHHAPLPAGVDCCAVAAVLGARGERLRGRWVGDGLVPLNSALGRDADPARALGSRPSQQWIARGMGHLELLWRPEVLTRLRTWMARSPAGSPRPAAGPARTAPGATHR